MVYALHKFKRYLLGNMFTFFVDHMALVYLINNPQVSNMLIIWLLLFLEYDFKIVYKLGRFHLMADALNRLPNHIEPVGVLDQIYDVHMFTLQPKWLQNVYEYLLKGVVLERLTTSQRAKPFVFQKGILYKFRQDNKFR